MLINIKIKVAWKEYELTKDWERKPTDDLEISIDIDPEEWIVGCIDESRSKFSPISIHKSE